MKRSNTEKDFIRIEESHHVNMILEELETKVPEYFTKISNSKAKNQNLVNTKLSWVTSINAGIEKYLKEANRYRELFHEDSMEEYSENNDPKPFKNDLRNKCPIISKSMNAKMKELQDWKEDFVRCKPGELLDTFENFLDFHMEYIEKNQDKDFETEDTYDDFKELHQFSSDEDLTLKSVIGAGIKTTTIYHLNPKFFCKSVRRTLYGMYFLTQDIREKTPSRTSEFIMIDDTNSWKKNRNSSLNFRMEHNYWYPYNLFMLYMNRVYKIIARLLNQMNISLNPDYRYIYVTIFLEEICALHKEAITTMMGGDQDF